MNAKEINQELSQKGDPGIAETSARFFKTGPGEYGEGDKFRGIRVPVLRKLARKFRETPLGEVEKLLHSQYHEDRLLALFLLIIHYSAADEAGKEKIYHLYLNSTRYINNWDLVDSSAGQIVGMFLWDKDRAMLYELADSPDLWERRISVMATFPYVKENDFRDILEISKKLLTDGHDLIHKAVGWMLREIGNRNMKIEEEFLMKHYKTMPRVMLRYAIEKFPENKRQFYLNRT